MVSQPIYTKAPVEETPEATDSRELQTLRTTPLGEAIRRSQYVRNIRQSVVQSAVPLQDRVVRTARPRTIVVVDDEPDLVELTVMILDGAGHCAYGATQGEAGIALVVEHTPDLLLVDYQMPGISGGELGKAVRSLPGLQHTTIVIVSGSSEETVRAEFDQFDLFLKKPAQPDRLLRLLEDMP